MAEELVKEEVVEEAPKKKRGRPKKSEATPVTEETTSEVVAEPVAETVTEEPVTEEVAVEPTVEVPVEIVAAEPTKAEVVIPFAAKEAPNFYVARANSPFNGTTISRVFR
jgi:hypothetical protein